MPDLPELVIFDCDGTLVDSEPIAVRIDRRMLADLGWHLEEQEIIERFVGAAHGEMGAAIERQLGTTLPSDWHGPYMPWFREAFEQELQLVEGVAELLEALDVPTCVASNTYHEGLRLRLELTGIADHFAGRVFSAQDVERGKPEPDLFLHAAEQMGADPSRCVVVEDSPAGVLAGAAAGMRVLAYAGTIVPRHRFPDGTTFFDRMQDVPALLVGSPA